MLALPEVAGSSARARWPRPFEWVWEGCDEQDFCAAVGGIIRARVTGRLGRRHPTAGARKLRAAGSGRRGGPDRRAAQTVQEIIGHEPLASVERSGPGPHVEPCVGGTDRDIARARDLRVAWTWRRDRGSARHP